MSRLDDLRHIAGLAGIHTRHVDALGVVHEPGEEVLERLIAALDLSTEVTPAEGRANGVGPLGLQPVYIIDAENPQPGLGLPALLNGGVFEWSCCCENGAEY